MRLFYTALFYFFLPLIFLRLWRKGAKLPAYRQRWNERLGNIPPLNSNKRVIWFHTVSVGEFIAAIPLIKHYIQDENFDVVVTTMTPTGSERVQNTFSDSVYHCYLPYDTPKFIKRFLSAIKPNLLVCLETELWPNLLHLCKKTDVDVVLANARMSEKSAKGYRRFSALTSPMLKSISLGAVQNEEDAQRLIELGLSQKNTSVIGNIKFDLNIDKEVKIRSTELKSSFSENGKYTIFIAASTHQGEDEPVLAAFTALKNKDKNIRLMLVPRHPERFEEVYQLCVASGFESAKRSSGKTSGIDIMLCDTMGELLMLYGAADIAFVGGSFIDNGGHNYIEPAAWSLPILSGPSTFNFREIAQILSQESALDIVQDSEALAKAIEQLLDNPEFAKEKGQAAKALAEKNRGALNRLIMGMDRLLASR